MIKRLITTILVVMMVSSLVLFGCKETTSEKTADEMIEEKSEEKTIEKEEETSGYIDVSASEAKELIESNPDIVIIDVSPFYDKGHIPGAVNYIWETVR